MTGMQSKDQGETRADTKIEAHTHDKHSNVNVSVNGKPVSILFISFENRFSSFPVGVLSKYKFIGALSVFSVIFLCNLFPALSVDTMIKKNPIVTDTPKPRE